VYRSLRAHGEDGYALIAPEMLQRDVRELDETQIRVALGMLERVELVVRHFDMARTFRVTVVGTSEDDTWRQFVDRAELEFDRARLIAPLDLAGALGIPLAEFETALLQWSADGLLQIDSGPRDWLLELLPAPADTPVRIEALLREYSTRQDARVEAMVGYAKGLSCRHQALAAHFGERLARCEDACDVCAGDVETARRPSHTPARHNIASPARHNAISSKDEDAAVTAVLRLLRDLPFQVGRTGVVRILKGSIKSSIGPDRCADWGALGGWTESAMERLVDGLVEQGLLARNLEGKFPVLELTSQGVQALRGAETAE
jgi:ATP-dependent DNA helicase RecQ